MNYISIKRATYFRLQRFCSQRTDAYAHSSKRWMQRDLDSGFLASSGGGGWRARWKTRRTPDLVSRPAATFDTTCRHGGRTHLPCAHNEALRGAAYKVEG